MMKKICLSVAIALSSFLCASAQGKSPRSFDNFDTSRGVEVHRGSFIPVAAKNRAAAAPTQSVPTAGGKRYLKPTGSTRMRPTEGLGTREMPRTEYNRLMMGTAAGMKGFTTGNIVYDSYIVESSRRYNIDPLLIYSQMHQESAFKLKALSHKGASGLMQLMPGTARRLGVTNIYDPKQNIDGGVKYMRMLLNMFGQDVTLALAGYNAGEGAVMKYGNSVPPYNETREYVRRISARYSSISNPQIARTLPRINDQVATRLLQTETQPLNIKQNAIAIKMADGRMRLVNQ